MARKFDVRDDFERLFYDELGRLVVAAGRVEYVLKLCIKSLLKMGNQATTFSEGFLEAEKLRKIPDLCKKANELANNQLPDDKKEPFRALVDQISELTGDRNDMIHAAWTTDDCRNPVRLRPEWKKGQEDVIWKKSGPVPLPALRDLRRRLEAAQLELQDLRRQW